MFSNRAQRGLALVIVLWILTLLTLMAGSFATTMRRETSVSSALKNNAEARALAESGIVLAQFMLKQDDSALRWRGDGTVYRLVRPDGELRVRILAEAGKVDINTSNQAQLGAVLNGAVDDKWQQQRLLNAILDWRDADDDTRTLGAERTQYRRAGLSYGPTNNAFQSLEELQLVLGMDEYVYSRIEPFLTVYSGNSEVNIEEAAPELLQLIDRGLKTQHIDNTALQKKLQDLGGADLEDDGGGETFTTDEQTYTIMAEAVLGEEGMAGLRAVVQSHGDDPSLPPYEILDWKQNSQGLSLFDAAMDDRVITLQDEFTYDDRP